MAVLRKILATMLWLVVIAALAVVIVPRFLDRIYYAGPASGHFDGERFFNPGVDDDTGQAPGGGSRAGFLWRQLTGQDGRPAWPGRVPVARATPTARVDGDAMVATWVGHATVLVQTAGLNILTDPVWSERAGPFGFGPKRVAAPGIVLEDLPRIDLIVVSHNHYDHMDLATLKRLWDRDRPLIVTAPGNDAILRSRGIGATAIDWGGSAPIVRRCGDGQACPMPRGAVKPRVHITRNHHWSSRWFTDRNRALWSSFVVRLPGGNLFVAGDTGFGDGRWPAEAAALGPVRLALIPIGAFRFVPGQMRSGSHIGPVEAAEVYRRLGASSAIPIHWGTFRLSYEGRETPPRLLAAAMRCGGMAGFAPVPIGAPQDIPAYRAPALPQVDVRSRGACLDTPAVRALR
jgi:L-ascorbate metabolism protein UlaG (beta-lactamase superfamily)